MVKGMLSKREETFFLSGFIDETFEFSALLPSQGGQLKLNFQAVLGISSLGLRHLIDLLATLENKSVAFFECPRLFVELFNHMPQVYGGRRHARRIVSCYAPYCCPACSLSVDVLVPLESVRFDCHELIVPSAKCHICRSAMNFIGDPMEYFLFTYG